MNDALNALKTRRSVSVRDMVAPAPSDVDLQQILTVATRVPDHGKLCPWRIVVLSEAGAVKLGDIAAQQFASANLQAEEKHLEAERQRFRRAPLCLAVLSMPILATKPVWEQELSAGSVCMNILHAAHALGYAGKWLTEWVAYDSAILAALVAASSPHSTHAAEQPRIAGFIYLGSKASEPEDRERPDLAEVVSELK